MFKDSISKDTKIFLGDVVYLYQYQKRKSVKTFNDLDKVTVTEVVPRYKQSDDIMVGGVKFSIDKGVEKDERIVGIVEYKRNGDLIETSEGNKFINYFIKDKKPVLCLKKIKSEYEYYDLYAVFQLDKGIEIKIKPYDLICYNQGNLIDLIKSTKIDHARFCNGYICFYLNGEELTFNEFDIFINNKKFNPDNRVKQLFDWACNNKNNINDAIYNFQKIFSMKLIGYESVEKKIKANQ